MDFFFAVGIRDDHKQVESSATGKQSELTDSFVKALTDDHQGRLTEISHLWIKDFCHKIFQQRKKCVFAILMANAALESGLKSNEFFFDS